MKIKSAILEDYIEELKDLSLIRERIAVAFPPHRELNLYLKAQAIIDLRIKYILKQLNNYIKRPVA